MSYNNIRPLYPFRAMSGSSPVASQSLTVSTAAVSPTGFTAAPAVNGVELVTFDVQTSNLRVRWDGTNPTSTVGHLLFAGTNYTWPTSMYNAAVFIRDTAATADGTVFASPLST